MSNIPKDRKYTREHEWALRRDEHYLVGITDYAVQQLGDVTLVDLPAVGTQVSVGDRFGDIESVKTVSELFAPLAGEVVEVNESLEQHPERVNEAPYESGWMVKIRPTEDQDAASLMEPAAYEQYLGEL